MKLHDKAEALSELLDFVGLILFLLTLAVIGAIA